MQVWEANSGTHESTGRTRQTRAYQEKRTCGEMRICLGEAPMTLQERLGLLRKLTSMQTMLQTTLMQPIGEDLVLVLIG